MPLDAVGLGEQNPSSGLGGPHVAETGTKRMSNTGAVAVKGIEEHQEENAQQGFAFPRNSSEEFTVSSYFLLYHSRGDVGETLKIRRAPPLPPRPSPHHSLPHNAFGSRVKCGSFCAPDTAHYHSTEHKQPPLYLSDSSTEKPLHSCFLLRAACRPPPHPRPLPLPLANDV